MVALMDYKAARDSARREVVARGKELLTPDNSGRGWICPVCGSGTGKNGTGITTQDGIHFTCWAGCYSNADILDIVGMEKGLDNYNDRLKECCSRLGVSLEGASRENQKQDKSSTLTQAQSHNQSYTTAIDEQADYTAFYAEAARHIGETDYHRGLSAHTLERFNIGFVAAWRHPKAPTTAPVSPRLIVPTSQGSYIARRTDGKEGKDYLPKMKVGAVQIFNSAALWESETPVFITEGELDALSIMDALPEATAAIGLGSAGNVKSLLKLVEARTPTQPLLLALDKDEKGQKAQAELKAGLERLSVPCFVVDISGEYKDANEALVQDREGFCSLLLEAINEPTAAAMAERWAEWEKLEQERVGNNIEGLFRAIEERKGSFVPTGFANLDSWLDGGLYAGLYCLGAVTSLGKTTFCLQMADQIASRGHAVMFFSLEMSRHELMAKSLSRLTYEESKRRGTTAYAKTTRGILTGSRYGASEQADREVLEQAVARYKENADQLYIIEGMGDVGAKQIREKVEQFKLATGGRVPAVIFVDYMQILAPADPKSTDKQNTDKAVLELKKISRDYGLAIVAISSFNRDSYTDPVYLTSFKESGAIEYSSDVLIGLQYDGMDYEEGEGEKKRTERVRDLLEEVNRDSLKGNSVKVQLKILKNRSGRKGNTTFSLNSMFNIYTVPEDYAVPNLTVGGQVPEGEYPVRMKSQSSNPVKERAEPVQADLLGLEAF